eukprot:3258500-Rhodomonas_salina.4
MSSHFSAVWVWPARFLTVLAMRTPLSLTSETTGAVACARSVPHTQYRAQGQYGAVSLTSEAPARVACAGSVPHTYASAVPVVSGTKR